MQAFWYTRWLVHLSLMTVLFVGESREPVASGVRLLLLLPRIPERDPVWINHRPPGVPVVLWVSPPMIDAVISVRRMDCKRWRMVKANASSVVGGKSFTLLSQSIKLMRRRKLGSAEVVSLRTWHWRSMGGVISVETAVYTWYICLYGH